MARSLDYNCPRCNSHVVAEHRGPDYEPLHFGTACGSNWYAAEEAYIPNGHEPGWNFPSAHTCKLVSTLTHQKRELEDKVEHLTRAVNSVNATNLGMDNKLARARRMLVAAGVTEAMIDAALEDLT